MSFFKTLRNRLPRSRFMGEVTAEPPDDPAGGAAPPSLPPWYDKLLANGEGSGLATSAAGVEQPVAPASGPGELPGATPGEQEKEPLAEEGEAVETSDPAGIDDLLSLFTEEGDPGDMEFHKLAMTLEEVDVHGLASECRAVASELRQRLGGMN